MCTVFCCLHVGLHYTLWPAFTRDGHEMYRDTHLPRRDRDVGFTSRDETLKFRDEAETRRL